MSSGRDHHMPLRNATSIIGTDSESGGWGTGCAALLGELFSAAENAMLRCRGRRGNQNVGGEGTAGVSNVDFELKWHSSAASEELAAMGAMVFAPHRCDLPSIKTALLQKLSRSLFACPRRFAVLRAMGLSGLLPRSPHQFAQNITNEVPPSASAHAPPPHPKEPPRTPPQTTRDRFLCL